jgi:hypothetical protein
LKDVTWRTKTGNRICNYIYIWNNSYSYLYSPNSMFIPCSYQNDYGFRECTPHPSRSSMVIVHDPFDEIHPWDSSKSIMVNA